MTVSLVQLSYSDLHGGSVPDENPQLIHTGDSHIEGDTLFSSLLPEDDIFKVGKAGKVFSHFARQVVYLCPDGIVCFDQEVFQDGIVSIP